MEIMLVIAIIGILAATLFPNFSAYQQKSRDTVRITAISIIHKSIATFFLDEDRYPDAVLGCIPDAVVMKYNAWQISHDKVSSHDNGCGANGNFGYGTGRDIVHPSAGTDEYVILARLEFPDTGNYADGLIALGGYTGSFTASGFWDAYNKRIKASGSWYITLK